ncbi:hypothetical protein [Aquimarina algicola]|uniref:Uncharacterized protein n=1 Tax=Aquimarina algicola TaxID=2589995 RepID=A0A504J325_9FLAO|nr:hypothetical protein [Aquimarina algicola]TPN82822.1 hypothetical protein FHK87_20560 [Aquimarina algicola]
MKNTTSKNKRKDKESQIVSKKQQTTLKNICCFFLFLVFVMLTSCKEEFNQFDWGLVEKNGVYLNKFFDFSFPVPEGYSYDDKHSKYWHEDTGEGIPWDENLYENKIRALNVPQNIKTTGIFLLEKEEALVTKKPKIFFFVENTAFINEDNITEIKNYLEYTKKDAQSNPSIELASEDFTKTKLDGETFYKIDATFKNEDVEYHRYFISLKKGFGFGILLKGNSKEDLNELERVLDDIDF